MSILTRGKLGGLALLLAAALGGAVGAASGEDLAPGCYERVYSPAHLSAHPGQVVSMLRFHVGQWVTEVARDATLSVVMVGQGGAVGLNPWGDALKQSLFCGSETQETVHCRVQCDGGGLEVTRQDAAGLTFRTRYLLVGEGQDGCGGLADLAEAPGQWVSYRLNRVDDVFCEDM
ncbi:hypothetical protein [Sagittula salina]|uniref:Uncharacterized protein n=1 Tax=Sagittula salina TaxID=2820268 RepID=A0A940MM68_9RHOB|nr:hypothetical protein [Sagittula salina]MBP0484061.1 hypothetical protein [Sagittula salina]